MPDDTMCKYCFGTGQFAFGLSNNLVYKAIALDFNGEVFAGRRFVEWMIRNRLKEIEQPAVGSLILYFSDSDWRHIGTADTSDRVVSQWGTFHRSIFERPWSGAMPKCCLRRFSCSRCNCSIVIGSSSCLGGSRLSLPSLLGFPPLKPRHSERPGS
jgi:hypothetical protein